MLGGNDLSKIEDQLQKKNSVQAVCDAYRFIANARPPSGITIHPAYHGNIQEIRFKSNGSWLYSAAVNKGSITWYFRNPAFKSGHVDPNLILTKFSTAERRKDGEIRVKILNTSDARDVLHFITGSQ